MKRKLANQEKYIKQLELQIKNNERRYDDLKIKLNNEIKLKNDLSQTLDDNKNELITLKERLGFIKDII